MDSVLVASCVHPYRKVKTVYMDADLAHEDEAVAFVWCRACRKVLEWGHYDKERRNVIPWNWSLSAQKLAHKLTGFRIEQPPDTYIRVPGLSLDVGASTLGSMLKKLYVPGQIAWVNSPLSKLTAPQVNGGFTVNSISPQSTFVTITSQPANIHTQAKKAAYKKLYGGK